MIIALAAVAAHAGVSGSVTGAKATAVTYEGESAIKFTADMRIKGMNGRKALMCLWIYNSDGTAHKVYDAGNKRTAEYIKKTVNVNHDSSVFNDYKFYIKLSDFKPLNGTHDYYAIATICNSSGKIIAQSPKVYFSANNSASPSKPKPQPKPKPKPAPAPKPSDSKSKSKETSTWTRTFKGDAYNRYTAFADGSMRVEMVTPCRWCNATGLCPFCGGAGGTWGRYTNTYTPCFHCGPVKGSCMYCKGGRYETNILYRTPDGKYAILSSDGKLTTSDEAAARREVEKERRHLHDSGRCPNCHGNHCESTPMYRNDPSGAAVQAVGQIGRTNLQGNHCPICGQWDYHIHLKCHLCD